MLFQISNMFFLRMQSWFKFKKNIVIFKKFLEKAKHFIDIHRLKTNAK